jgi:alkanesulfonate monooxygenase
MAQCTSPAVTSADQDPEYPVHAAGLIDEAGFDWLLIGYSPAAPDAMLVANEVLTTTSRLGVVVARVPGLVAPTIAARQLATLAAFHRGRVALHAVTEFEADARHDGDAFDPAWRPRRAAEFLKISRLAWTSPQPFDYSGEFYQVAGATPAPQPAGKKIGVYLAGESADALRVGAACADVYLLADEPLPALARRMARLSAAAGRHGRPLRFGVSLRLITAPTRLAATQRYDRVASAGYQGGRAGAWIPPANLRLTIGASLVGSYDDVAQALLDRVRAGIDTLVIGHDPVTDATDCAAVIERVREKTESLSRLAC